MHRCRADRDHVFVEHHEAQSTIPLEGMCFEVAHNRFAFPGLEPVIARQRGVVLVDFAVTLLPREEFAAGNTDPLNESGFSELGFGCPIANEVDDLIARVMGNPTAAQGSPSSFFRATYSSDISAMMLSFLTSLASS